jgi:hypothetical protein
VNAAKQGEQIVNEAEQALQPLNAVQAQVGKVKDAVDEATKNLPLGPGQEGDIEMTGLGNSGESAATGAASETTGLGEAESGNVSGKGAELESAATQSAATQSAATQSKEKDDTFGTTSDIHDRLGGGSRKRRRIHKLSRRIERTLRRVQKKYGLQGNQGNQSNQGKQDKNGFLKRTLRHRKP